MHYTDQEATLKTIILRQMSLKIPEMPGEGIFLLVILLGHAFEARNVLDHDLAFLFKFCLGIDGLEILFSVHLHLETASRPINVACMLGSLGDTLDMVLLGW